MEIKFIDLFAGIGGFRYGLERANDYRELLQGKETKKLHKNCPDTKGRQTRFTCVWSNEWDKYASDIYKKHYRECDTRDIRTIKSNEIPDFDLLVGGFPCQAFSIAGKRGGFGDTRGTLFFEIARILADKRPRYFLLENVKGLLSHDEGKTFQTILGVLADLGYEYQWQVLNSKNFGVPQNRERVFIIGHLRGTSRPKVFPFTDRDEPIESSTCLDSNYWKGADKHGQRTLIELTINESDASRVYNPEGIAKTLKGLGGGLGAKTGLYAMQWRRTEKGKEVRRINQQQGRDYTPFSEGHRELIPKEGKPIGAITSQAIAKDSLLGNNMVVRRLTPVECARLQGFPDDWCEGLSDTQAYKCYGNAVTTNVVTEIGKRLLW